MVGWAWEYEPFDMAGYIPDFAILGQRPCIVDVKPALSIAVLYGRAEALDQKLDGFGSRDALFLGATIFRDRDWGFPVIGVAHQHGVPSDENSNALYPAEALLHTCGKCGDTAWHHALGDWDGVPCGHYDGDHYLEPIDPDLAIETFRKAKNHVQWNSV
jgi:hypothetical protein